MSENNVVLDLRGEICPYPMLKTNEYLDKNVSVKILDGE